MTEIPLKHKKINEIPLETENDQNTPQKLKITKIPSKPKNDRNTLKT